MGDKQQQVMEASLVIKEKKTMSTQPTAPTPTEQVYGSHLDVEGYRLGTAGNNLATGSWIFVVHRKLFFQLIFLKSSLGWRKRSLVHVNLYNYCVCVLCVVF